MKRKEIRLHQLVSQALVVILAGILTVAAASCNLGNQSSELRESSSTNRSAVTNSDSQIQNLQPPSATTISKGSESATVSASTSDYPMLPSPSNPSEFKDAVFTRISPTPDDQNSPNYYLHPKFRVPDYTKRLRAGEFTIQDLRTMFGFDQVRFYAIEPEKKPISLPVGGGDQTIYAESEVQSINQEVCDWDTKYEDLMKSLSDNAAIAKKYINYVFLYYLALGHEPPRTLREIVDLNLLPVKLSPKEFNDLNYVLLNCGASYSQIALLYEGVIAANLKFPEVPSYEVATDYARYKIYAQLPTWGGFGVVGHPELLKEHENTFVAPYDETGVIYPRDNMQRLKEWMRSHPTLTINEEFFRLAEQTPWAKEDEWD